VEDYLYAVDGMDVWRTIEGQVRSYYAHFYYSDTTVPADAEL
jgi:lipoxygenase